MNFSKLASAVLFIALLASCASHQPTPFVLAQDEGDFGYSHTKLTNEQYRINFRANRLTDKGTIRDYALLHAADLTVQQGYDWFAISHQDMDTNKQEVQVNTSTGNIRTASSTRCGLFGCTTVHHPTLSTYAIETEEITTDHHFTMTITMGKDKPGNPDSAYDADELAKNIRSSVYPWMNTDH